MPSEPLDFMEALDALALPKVEQKPWMLKTHMELVTADNLDRVVDECLAAGVYGFDIETTGLDNRVFYSDDGSPYTVDKTVGFCLAPSEDRGYYLPVRHRNPKTGNMHEANVPMRLVVPALQRLVGSPAKAAFHNAKFDQEFLQHEVMGGLGEWDDPDKWDDTFILAYMRNTRERNKGLKHLSAVELQREMIELDELFTPEEIKAGGLNFGNLDPTWEPSLWYACSDAMCTLGLRRVLLPQVVETDANKNDQRALYKIEKSCVSATRWMERCRIPIDRPKVGELIRIGQREWFACLNEVYAEINKALARDARPKWMLVMQEHPTLRFDPESVQPSYMDARETAMAHAGEDDNRKVEKSVPSLLDPRKQETVAFPVTYDVTIPEQLGLLMRELGVQGLRATEKSGQVKTSKDELERVIEEAGDEYPYMGKIRRFREVAKALSSNLFPIWHDTSPERSPDGRIRVSFNAHKVDTGRFSTPTPREEARFTGQVRWNLHSIPATYDKKKPECMRRMREIIRVADDKVLYAIDYSGVELRIVTNLSSEPKWIEEFFRCSECDTKFDKGQGTKPPPHFCPKCGSDKIGDLHTLTALAIYGAGAKDSPDFKQKRQSSKALNFAMCYGGGGSAAQRAVGVDKEEGWRIKNQFDKSYTGLRRWWGTQHETARRWTYVRTAFGRKYPLPDILHTDGGFRSKAERNSVNGPVQGTSADIMKLAMVLIYREFKKRGWLRRAKAIVTIHDELVFEVDGDIAEDMVDVTVPLMVEKTVAPLGWLVPLKVDIEFGQDWLVPLNLIELEHGKKAWPEKWAKMFPRRAAGATTVASPPTMPPTTPPSPPVAPVAPTAAAPAPVAASPVAQTVEANPSEPAQTPGTTVEGGRCVHVIHTSRLSFGLMDKLARVIQRCEGRGTVPLRIVTEGGEVLLDEGARVKVAPGEFKAIAMYEGI
jgi:DNA polymerase I-like protein with 3'-5' exonuclease and polymerase domains